METMDIKTYNKFYKENRRALFNFIFKMTHDVETSEELVNDVFVKVHQVQHRYDPTKASFKTWVYNIASNATIDYLRKKKLQTKSMNDLMTDSDGDKTVEIQFVSNDADPLEKLIRNESTEKISAAINTLSAQQAEILSQYALGYSYEDIAAELNMPLGTVKGSLHHARIQMREYFNKPVLA